MKLMFESAKPVEKINVVIQMQFEFDGMRELNRNEWHKTQCNWLTACGYSNLINLLDSLNWIPKLKTFSLKWSLIQQIKLNEAALPKLTVIILLLRHD